MLKNNRIFVIISILCFFLVAWPILSVGYPATFFNLDPSVHYLSSALSYVQQGLIRYTDHPGTPTIFLFIYALTPFRIFTEFISQTSFSTWTYLHFNFLYFSFRLLQSLILSLAFGLFLSAIYKVSHSLYSVATAGLAIFTYTAFPYFGITISAESLSFLLIAVWLTFFAVYLRSYSPRLLIVLSFISGFAFGNKFSNLILLVIPPVLVLLQPNFNRRALFKNLFISLFLLPIGFLVATWPIRGAYRHLFDWAFILATRTEVHGNGQISLFNLSAYKLSVASLVGLEFKFIWFVVFSLILVIFSLFRKTISTALLAVFFIALFGALIFAKYPLSHYQLTSFSLIVFVTAYLVIQLHSPLFRTLLLFLLLNLSLTNIQNYYKQTADAINETITLDRFVSSHPPRKAVVWEYGNSRDYALIWTRAWGYGFLAREIKSYRPDLLELAFPDKIIFNYGRAEPLFNLCWDQLYIQKSSLKQFYLANPKAKFTSQEIPGLSTHLLLISDHCLTNPKLSKSKPGHFQ